MAAFEQRSCLLRSGRGRPRYGAKGKLRVLRNVSTIPEKTGGRFLVIVHRDKEPSLCLKKTGRNTEAEALRREALERARRYPENAVCAGMIKALS